MKYTREQLIKGMQKYNQDYISNPDDYSEIDGELWTAEAQVDKLLTFVKQ